MTIKFGTNKGHGTLFEFLQNGKLNANPWELNRNNKPRQPSEPARCGSRRPDRQATQVLVCRLLRALIRDGSSASMLTVPSLSMAGGDLSSIIRAGDMLGQDAMGRRITRGQTHPLPAPIPIRDGGPTAISQRVRRRRSSCCYKYPRPNTCERSRPPVNALQCVNTGAVSALPSNLSESCEQPGRLRSEQALGAPARCPLAVREVI